MSRDNRIFWSDNGVLVDLTARLNDFTQTTKVIPFVAAQDALYLGSTFPFNHRHFELTVANSTVSAVSISLWNGKSFTAAENFMDQTIDLATETKSLARSGIISWEKSDQDNWVRDNTEKMTGVLSTLRIDELYWAKLTWSGDWDVLTEISFIGHKFSNDTDLAQVYPDLNKPEVKDQFETGKVDWNDQHLWAARTIIRDMKNQDYMVSENQIIRWENLCEPSVHKVAELIFISQGKDADDLRVLAKKYYEETLKMVAAEIDTNLDTKLNSKESVPDFSVTRR